MLLVSCRKTNTEEANQLKLNLIKAIDLSEFIEEEPTWLVTEDRIFLSCYQEILIQAIDYEGNLIAELDEVGVGPGEIKGLTQPYYNHNTNEIEYNDWEQSKVNYFDYDLNYLRSEQSPQGWIFYKHYFPENVFIYNRNFENVDGKYMFQYITQIEFSDTTKTMNQIEYNIMSYVDLEKQFHSVASSDLIYVGTGSTEKIIIDSYNTNGEKQNHFEYAYPKVMKDDEELNSLKEQIAQGRKYKNYKHHLAITSLGIDNQNRVWVFNYTPTGNRNLMTFTESGELLNALDLGTTNCDIKIHNDKMYEIVWDEDDMFSLEIYQIEG